MRSCFLPVVVVLILIEAPDRGGSKQVEVVKTWAHKLGFELSTLAKFVTKMEKVQENYKTAEVTPRDGNALVHEIAKDIKAMMESKISAIKRIMDVAETSAMSSPDIDPPESYEFVNAKNNSIDFEDSRHFGGYVNLNMSAVHVPTNVYERTSEVIRAIKWSEELDRTFINNYEQDPSLSWQYFGSATGFMRQYPAINWSMQPVDLFDCRTRSWYIEAATSPKDVLILLDTSGSMHGIRREIAKHVINNILDTLGNNDFVNIITFSNVTKGVVSCFNDTLVQANLANIRELKQAIKDLSMNDIANFSLALKTAFELLETFRNEREGAMCNQAIMLITDGAPYNYNEIFKTYNWRNQDKPTDMPVRVFTYLIGREAETREAKWMACANRGYYVHLCTPAEVREEVLKYVPVMARPLVINRTIHQTIWTPVYADITDPKITDWLWEQRENEEQKERSMLYQGNKKWTLEEQNQRFYKARWRELEDQLDMPSYKLMTSVSVPVFDRRENATMIANLLGVAGTDVPIEEIQKLMIPHMLGVNGYAFIVTNNGFILIHPDLRPVFQGILKPAYNSVDMAEIELMDNDKGPREFDEGIIMLRNDVVNQANGSVTLHTRYHYDDMKRVGRIKRKYDYTGIMDTPFTVVVSLPEHEFGSYRVHATEEIHRSHVKGKNVTDYFAGSNWRVHPDWLYCKYHYEGEHRFPSSELQLLHFLERTRQPGWKWIDMKQRSQPPEYSAASSNHSSHSYKADRNSYYCDRNLLLSLVFDAKVTEWFAQQTPANPSANREEAGKQFQQRFGITVAFMATHSGLTRWQNYYSDEDEDAPLPGDQFSKQHPRAIDEVWYKRAVEQYYVLPDSFVYSVPLDEIADNTTLVTASHAIFIGGSSGGPKAPAAVIGFQFQHTALQTLFQNITFNCKENCGKDKHCGDDALACYLIDEHGYVIAAKNNTDAGKFFGEIRGPIMNSLVKEGIYERIRIFDYQAVCFQGVTTNNAGSILLTPWKHLQKAIFWLISQLTWVWAKAGMMDPNYMYSESYVGPGEESVHNDSDENEKPLPSEPKDDRATLALHRTQLKVCDQEVFLYLRNATFLFMNFSKTELETDYQNCIRQYIVQPVPNSNMLLMVVNLDCGDTSLPPLSIEPEEVIYENNSLVCQKALIGLKRRRPQFCLNSNEYESELKHQCGLATSARSNLLLLTTTILLLLCMLTRRPVQIFG